MYAILRTKKLKTKQQLKNQMGHASRSMRVSNANTDAAKLNHCIVQSDYDAYVSELDTLKKRRNSVIGIDIFLGASPEFFGSALQESRQKYLDWITANKEFLEEEFGANNIRGLYVHRDEQTPHIQALIIPRVEQRLNAGKWLNGREALQHLQDKYAQKMQTFGLQRGVCGSKAKHTDIKKYYARVNEIMKKEQEGTGNRLKPLLVINRQ